MQRLRELGVDIDEPTEEEATSADNGSETEEAEQETATVVTTDAPDQNTDSPLGCSSAIGTAFAGVAILLLSCGVILRKRED